MPGQPIIMRERVIALETWRDEHRLQHDREFQRTEGSATRHVTMVAACVAGIAAIIGGVIGGLIMHALS